MFWKKKSKGLENQSSDEAIKKKIVENSKLDSIEDKKTCIKNC